MNYRILLLVFLVCITAVPAMTASGDYMGGNIVLGGSGPKVTQITTTTVEVTATKVPQKVLPATGALSVTTSPSGASIIIDGTLSGTSPSTVTGLSPGSHTLLLRLDGYNEISVPVTIAAGQTQTSATTLSPFAASQPAASLPKTTRKTPGFEPVCCIAALGAVLVTAKTIR